MTPMESDQPAGPQDQKSTILRNPDPNEAQSRKSLVSEWCGKVNRAKRHWGEAHKRMREDMDFFMGKQWPFPKENEDRYVANIVQRHVQQRVASLYAKNPKAVAKRRKTMDFAIWDGSAGSLDSARVANELSMQQFGMPNPEAMALMQDVTQGFERRKLIDKMAETLEIVFHQIVESQNLKTNMKQFVRRVCVTGVGFLKIGYSRTMGKRPEDLEKVTDMREQINMLQRLLADKFDAKFDENSARMEQLNLMVNEIMSRPDAVIDEGLVFDFPQSQNIIIDTRCRQLKGFVGAEWIAHEFMLTLDEVKDLYSIDLGSSYTKQEEIYNGENAKSEAELCRVWEIYCKRDGLKYVVADGYPDFLVPPAPPEIRLKRFWPFFVLAFNEVENDREIYPPSDVRLLTPVQREYNLARQRLREHRNANRPLYVTPTGALSETDVKKLIDRDANEVIQLQAIQPGQSVEQVLQAMKPVPIDPSLYDTEHLISDMFRIVGTQEANLGTPGGASTATEVSVAESSRMSSLGSNVDDLDEFLIEMSRSAGELLLKMMNPETATKIAGVGAVWPTLSAQEISENLLLDIEAGSSGRPNRAAEIAAFERLAPTLLQIPGIDPTWFAKEAIKRLDDGLDVTDAIKSALPSIVAQNSQKQVAQANAMSSPENQGGEGGNNAARGSQPQGTGGGVQVPNVPAANLYNAPPPPPNAR